MRVSRSSLAILTIAVNQALADTVSKANPKCVNGPVAGTTCTVECGIDRLGGDYSALQAKTFNDCVKACSQDPRCVTAQYHTDRQYCYLKNSVNPARASVAVDGVVCRRSTSLSMSTTTTRRLATTINTVLPSFTTRSTTKSTVTTTTTTTTAPVVTPSCDAFKIVATSPEQYKGYFFVTSYYIKLSNGSNGTQPSVYGRRGPYIGDIESTIELLFVSKQTPPYSPLYANFPEGQDDPLPRPIACNLENPLGTTNFGAFTCDYEGTPPGTTRFSTCGVPGPNGIDIYVGPTPVCASGVFLTFEAIPVLDRCQR